MDREISSTPTWFLCGLALGAVSILLFASEAREGAGSSLVPTGGRSLGQRGRELFNMGRELFERGREVAEDAAEQFERNRVLPEHQANETV